MPVRLSSRRARGSRRLPRTAWALRVTRVTRVSGGGSLRARSTRAAPPVTCPRCAVDYRAGLTAGACPVCGTAAPGAAPARRVPGLDRDVALIAGATIANMVLLGVLALALLHR